MAAWFLKIVRLRTEKTFGFNDAKQILRRQPKTKDHGFFKNVRKTGNTIFKKNGSGFLARLLSDIQLG